MDAVTGIGLRQPHYAAFTAQRPALPFVEVHSENFFGDGGAALQVLQGVRADWSVSLHGVGLGLGSAAGLDPWHLDRLARLAERVDPLRISDHASFARAGGRHANDLLPIAFTRASLDRLVANVQQVQERLRRPIGVENISAYLGWDHEAELPEPAFFAELARRSGCWLLLDVNNLVVNALNAGQDPVAAPCAWIDALGPEAPVGEIHLAGYHAGGELVIDDHGSRVHPPVWRVFAHAIARFGPRPTLVEWDTDLPALEVLLQEAAAAEAIVRGR
jgi:uncharacterized protein (UPF0276 family)